mgnify:CR=1 FL=1
MRVFFFLFFLLYTISGNAVTVDCDLNQTECERTAGCHWENESCNPCTPKFFCTGYQNWERPCGEDDDFEFSFEGATSIHDCYKKITTNDNTCVASDGSTTQNCGLFYPNGTPKCLNDDGTYSEDYHIDSHDSRCYANGIPCRNFGSSNCQMNQISGTADWHPDMEKELPIILTVQ